MTPATPGAGGSDTAIAARIAGLSILKGLVLYGATLAFAGLYAYFMARIVAADHGPPKLDTAMVTAAAGLAGVLGSAFALYIGIPTDATNEGLAKALEQTESKSFFRDVDRALATIRKMLSLEPGGQDVASWPLTFGIWVYAMVASAVALTYLLNRAETPPEIKALAVVFGGYVIAFVTAAYGLAGKSK